MRVQQSLFSSFHFTWLSPEQHIHEWTERKMSKRGQMIAIRVFLCNYVIIFVWKPYPSLMHSAPLPGGSCSSPVTKCVVARRRGGTQGWGRRQARHQHVLPGLLLCAGHTRNTWHVTVTVQTWDAESPVCCQKSLGGREDVRQDTQPARLNTAKDMKSEEDWETVNRPKNTRETRLNAMYSRLDPGTERGHERKNRWDPSLEFS